jgi:5-methylcytosine-specific restriction endonuclease McrA
MKDILHKNIVLVLNRNWQAINTTTPADAFGQMARDVATGLDVFGADWMLPVKWPEWLKLRVRAHDLGVRTVDGVVRVPTVVVLCRFDRVPMMRPKFSLRGLWQRDGGRCQYTGRNLSLREGNIDHVVPQSRGGETSWENCVLSDRDVNQRKADRTPREAGLSLRTDPVRPPEMPATWFIRNPFGIPDWEVFLPRRFKNNKESNNNDN